MRYVPNDVLVEHHVVRGFEKRVELLIDLALAGTADLMVMTLDGQTAPLHGLDHLQAFFGA